MKKQIILFECHYHAHNKYTRTYVFITNVTIKTFYIIYIYEAHKQYVTTVEILQ